MTKRAKLPGTGHSSTFNRHERPILEDIEGAPNVRKLKTGRMDWTGPTHRQRLQLRAVTIEGSRKLIYAGLLLTGSGKRHLKLYPMPGVTTEALCQELGAILDRRGVTVEIASQQKTEEPTMQNTTNGHQPMSTEDLWDYCGLIMHDGDEQTKTLAAQEVDIVTKLGNLQTQLDTVRRQKQDVKARALEALSHALRDLSTTR